MPRRTALLVAVLALLVAGCGGGDGAGPGPATTASTAAAPRPAPERVLAKLQITGGLAATLDELTVREDGSATLDRRYGGAGRRTSRLHVAPAELARLRAALGRLPASVPDTPLASDEATYLLSYRGRSLAAHESSLPRRGGDAFRIMRAIAARGAG